MLVVVLMVAALLALGAYTFAELMLVERQASAAFARDAQARALADSGVELAASLLTRRYEQDSSSFYHNPEWFQGVLLREAASARGQGRFSLVAPVISDIAGTSLRFGLIDESAKLNVNGILKLGLSDEDARMLFMGLPEMMPDIADAILDFIDDDLVPREFGCEDEYYSTLGYTAKNGPLESIDELMLVRGVTPWLLFGEDANRNGLLDPRENDGPGNLPLDNSDGTLQRGWAAFLTIYGREINVRSDGQPRINVNQNALTELYDQLLNEFDEDTAQFIIAFRTTGPVRKSDSGDPQSPGSPGGGASPGGGGSPGGRGAGQGGSGAQVTTRRNARSEAGNSAQVNRRTRVNNDAGNSAQVNRRQDVSGNASTSGGGSGASGSGSQSGGVQGVAGAVGQAASMAGQGQVTRGGIDITEGGRVQIQSLFELVDAEVQATIDGKQTTLTSPWSSESSDLQASLPRLLDALTTKEDKFIEGRLNISQAPRELLVGLPGMDGMIADAITNAQATTLGAGSLGQIPERATVGWLLIEGITDIETIRRLDPYITARGDVFRVQSVGYFEGGGPMARVEAVIDGTREPPQVVFSRDLTDLGRGFTPALLTSGVGSTE